MTGIETGLDEFHSILPSYDTPLDIDMVGEVGRGWEGGGGMGVGWRGSWELGVK